MLHIRVTKIVFASTSKEEQSTGLFHFQRVIKASLYALRIKFAVKLFMEFFSSVLQLNPFGQSNFEDSLVINVWL